MCCRAPYFDVSKGDWRGIAVRRSGHGVRLTVGTMAPYDTIFQGVTRSTLCRLVSLRPLRKITAHQPREIPPMSGPIGCVWSLLATEGKRRTGRSARWPRTRSEPVSTRSRSSNHAVAVRLGGEVRHIRRLVDKRRIPIVNAGIFSGSTRRDRCLARRRASAGGRRTSGGTTVIASSPRCGRSSTGQVSPGWNGGAEHAPREEAEVPWRALAGSRPDGVLATARRRGRRAPRCFEEERRRAVPHDRRAPRAVGAFGRPQRRQGYVRRLPPAVGSRRRPSTSHFCGRGD